MASMANMAVDGADPRLKFSEAGLDEKHFQGRGSETDLEPSYIRPQQRRLHDAGVSFEEYRFYADRTRADEDAAAKNDVSSKKSGLLSIIFPSKKGTPEEEEAARKGQELLHRLNLNDVHARAQVTDEEWANASRALRNATMAGVFYLITTDILGPFGLPYAFATTGYGPGAALFTVFGFVAMYSGWLLWTIFLGLDSYQFPIKSFGDLGYRLGGPVLRHAFNILQGIQLILNVGLIVISNGEALSQAANFKLCFIICCLVWCIIGFFFGQVRTLQKFGFLANGAVWLNVAIMIVSMIGAAKYGPLFSTYATSAGASFDDGRSVTPDAQGNFPPPTTSAGLPTTDFGASVNGAAQAIFSYGGAMIFPEFMSELRRPRDFLQAAIAAQTFILVVYLLYGLFLYSYQGSYCANPSYLGIPGAGYQLAGNILAMVRRYDQN